MSRRRPTAAVARCLVACSLAAGMGFAGWAGAQSTKPATNRGPSTAPSTRPSTQPVDPRSTSSDELLGQMLRPPPGGQPRPLQPIVDAPVADVTSGPGAVKPAAPAVATLREGTYLPDRVGRLARSADGTRAEFVFESDGRAMQDPPLVIVPNLKLQMMEDQVRGATRDLRFRVSGLITEYRGRNYILLEKAFVMPDPQQQF